MKVLWFSTNSAGYQPCTPQNKGYNGGGWMSALQNEIQQQPNIELGISFCMNGEPERITQESVTYYPVPHHKKNKKDKILDIIHLNDIRRDEVVWQHYLTNFRRIILDFNPEIIEVFGSELYIGLATIVAKELNVPCCLHIQGILSSCIYSFLPPGMSQWGYYLSEGIWNIYNKIQYNAYWRRSCYREKVILRNVLHVIGRTQWDKQNMEILAPQAKYHYGGEILRNEFYLTERTIISSNIITTIISDATYKGLDLLLKIAEILKNILNIEFTWRVFGNITSTTTERLTKIRHDNVNVELCGVADAKQLCNALKESTIYCHTSYIENSANSISEAQITGIPVVATNVGGTSSIVSHGETGFLFPATDPYMAAYYIKQLIDDNHLNKQIGEQSRVVAQERHNKKEITKQLIATYRRIIQETKE